MLYEKVMVGGCGQIRAYLALPIMRRADRTRLRVESGSICAQDACSPDGAVFGCRRARGVLLHHDLATIDLRKPDAEHARAGRDPRT
jgi:hypothetical protein